MHLRRLHSYGQAVWSGRSTLSEGQPASEAVSIPRTLLAFVATGLQPTILPCTLLAFVATGLQPTILPLLSSHDPLIKRLVRFNLPLKSSIGMACGDLPLSMTWIPPT